jgi:hypothetical protein
MENPNLVATRQKLIELARKGLILPGATEADREASVKRSGEVQAQQSSTGQVVFVRTKSAARKTSL